MYMMLKVKTNISNINYRCIFQSSLLTTVHDTNLGYSIRNDWLHPFWLNTHNICRQLGTGGNLSYRRGRQETNTRYVNIIPAMPTTVLLPFHEWWDLKKKHIAGSMEITHLWFMFTARSRTTQGHMLHSLPDRNKKETHMVLFMVLS